MEAAAATEQHVRGFFAGHVVDSKRWLPGPGVQAMPGLSVLEVAPGPRLNRWTYVTAGAAEVGLRRLEFLTIGDQALETYVELLTMVAYYGRDQRLGMGHTIPIGRPLVDGSSCEYLYLSLPYLFGPALEIVGAGPDAIQVLWLLPITAAEKAFLREAGLDAFEERLESEGVEYWSPYRRSVV